MSILSGILGRSPLANFSLARVPAIIVTAGPCPYIPAKYITLASRESDASSGPLLGTSIPAAIRFSTDQFASNVAISQTLVPKEAIGVGFAGRAAQSFTAPPAYTPVSDVGSQLPQIATPPVSSFAVSVHTTADGPLAAEPLPVAPSLDGKAPPTADSLPVKKIECR